MSDYSKILTKEDLEVINERFSLDLSYNDARHYRAAQVIRNLWKSQGQDIHKPEEDNSEASKP
ncbi:MAG: hypothetical protein WD426_09160 [Anditalea sp.]